MENNKDLKDCLEAISIELGEGPDTCKERLIKRIEILKEQASAYQTMVCGSKVDAMVTCLIKDMSALELWRKIFNKMTKPAKRQLINELLNSLLGNGYSTKPYIFSYNNDEEEKDEG